MTRNIMCGKIFKAGLLLIMSVMGTGSALAETSTWDGTTKHTTLAAAGISGAGTEGDPYIINSADKFVAFGTLANNSTAYWKLTVDIDLGGHEWPYSGDNAKTFKGHFDGQNDGQNHIISNYKITPIHNKVNGLFGTVQGSNATTRAEIKNLRIDDVTITTTENLGSNTHIGALVGNSGQYADYKNVQIVDASSNGKTVSITLDNLTGNCNIGGLIGSLQKNSTMEDITVNKPVILIKGEGTVSGGCNIGGAIGYVTGANATDVTKIDKPTSGSTNGLTVNNPSVTVHKILSSWYISTTIGRINNYSDVNHVTVANPELIYKAVGSPNNGLYLGTLTGNIQGNGGSATATPIPTPVKNINITGTSQITIGTGSEEIKNVRAGVVGLINTNVDIATWNVATSNITVNGSLTISTNYFGGVIGHVQSNQSAASTDTQTAVDDVELGSSTITVTGDVVKESYIGSIFGRIEGHNGNASNKPKRTVVTDITTTGLTKVVFGSNLNPVSVANVRAGAIGFLGINSELSSKTPNHNTIANTQIELNGTLDTGSSYLGGVVAHVQSSNTAFAGVAANAIATKVDDLTVTSSTVNVTGNVTKESYVGSAFGRLDGNVGNATVAPQHVLASNITAGTMAVTFGTNETPVDVAAVKAGLVGHALNYATVKDWNITTSNVTLNGTIATTAGYLGGVIGQVQSAQSLASGTDFTNISAVTLGSSTVTVTGNITKDSYIGSLFGRVEGTAGNATNYPKRTTVTGVTTSGITKVVFGSNSKNSDVAGVRAGAIGSAAANAEITHSTLADTQIELNGNFVTSTGYLGGIVGQVQSSTTAFPGILENAIGTKIDDITVKNSNVNVTGNVAKELNVGGGFGRFEGATSTTVAWQATKVTNINFKNAGNTGMSSVTIGTNNTNTINYIRAGVAGMAYQNVITRGWDIEKANVQVNGKLQTTSSYVGGCIGHVQSNNNAPVTMSNMQITVSDVVAINGDIEKDTYIGGAFGRMDQNNGNTNNQPATAENVKITGLDMSFGGNFTQPVYAGGVVGYLAAVNKTLSDASSVINCSASGQIHSSASKTFVQDKTYAFGGIVGYNNQNATTNRSEIKQCISEVNFDLSGYTPASVSGSSYNLYKQGFVIGGVIGRIDNPSLLPEHLYYSGKIYAPFAVVGPIIGTFQKSLGGASYVYEDYTGEYAAPTLSAAEWEKEKSWYYNNYQLGLSVAVRTQTARSKNYTGATTTIGGVEYLTVTDNTFQEGNVINSGKLSKTVLRYTANNKDVDMGIFPQWTTNSVTYPAYYMYYMQGVNRGVYMDNVAFAKELIKNEVSILPNMMTTQASGSYTFTTSLGAVESNDKFSISYQWLKKDETALGQTTKAITVTDDDLTTYGGTVYCVITVNGPNSTSKTFTLRGSNAYVVFVNGASGQDNAGDATTRGWTPETAVKTLNHANKLLRTTANGGSVETNIIVVMGTLNSDGDFRSDGKNPATITGRYDGKDYAGIIKIKQINAGAGGSENSVNPINPETGAQGSNCYVQADTKFEYLTFQANSANDGNNFIELHGNDVTFGKGLSMTNFRNLTKNHGNLDAAQNIPELTIVLTATNLNEETIRKYTDRTKPQVVTFESGRYGRIMGGRYTNGFFAAGTNTSHTILGSAEHPVWAIVNIDIEKNNPNIGTITRSEAPTGTVTNNFTCDINCIIAGLTDGSMYGDYQINVSGGKIGYIVGGNQGNPVANGSKTFVQPGGKSGNWGQWPNATYFGRTVINVEQDENLKDIDIENLYAGGLGREKNGNDATTTVVDMYLYGRTEVNMKSGTVSGNVYGGGAGGVLGVNPWDMHLPYATAEVDNSVNAIMNKVQYCAQGVKPADADFAKVTLHNSDGAGGFNTEQLNLAESSTTLNISGGTIKGSVYGGGYGYVSNMPVEVTMQGVGSVFGTSNINITGGEIRGSVYGGSQGASEYYGKKNNYGQTIDHIAEMNGTVNLNISGTSGKYPTIGGSVYGAGQGIASGYNSTTKKNEEYPRIATTGNSDLGEYTSAVNIIVDLPDNVEFPFDIYGGGEMGKVDGNINITLKGGKLTGNVYGGGLGEPTHLDKAKVTGNTTINMLAGDPVRTLSIGKNDAARNIYGGGNLAQLVGNTTLQLNHGSVVGNVYGGGKGLSKAESGSFVGYGKVTGNSTITMNNTTADTSISGDIFGGGALGELTGNTAFTIDNGTVGGYVYGGGALADVGGNTMVNLYGGSVAGAYGGGLGSNDVAAIVGGNATVQLGTNDGTASSKVTGEGLFGGNNLNGTPKGHAFVHVLKTTSRGQANRNVAGNEENFDVKAVYGGGNKAAYDPNLDPEKGGNADQFAKVLIENCDNSIAYVYGGGNAAPVPATQVIIHGADAIDNAFAGGNGAGTGNLGADIGYLEYTRDDIHKYGNGTASITVDGGTIHNVYGGSNTLGYIRTSTSVNVASSSADSNCPVNVDYTYGGGNKADLTCNIVMNMTCEKGVKALFAGANQANVLGDATLNIYSGVYEQVFGGNDQSGVIKGKLTVNVDETGCYPIEIGELYGCGNNAPYSVYGYNSDNTPRTVEQYALLTPGDIAEERLPYGDPEVNVISCTKIGRIFGGGYSTGATVYGNTHVNVNLIEGRWSGQEVNPNYKLDANYQMVKNSETFTNPKGFGKIGNIYGGGNEAGVVGNTYVNIYTSRYNSHIDNPDTTVSVDKSPQDSGVNIEGDVFGGSKGLESDPEAGKITGTTNVNIGYE